MSIEATCERYLRIWIQLHIRTRIRNSWLAPSKTFPRNSRKRFQDQSIIRRDTYIINVILTAPALHIWMKTILENVSKRSR